MTSQPHSARVVAVAMLAAATLGACTTSGAEASPEEPITIEEIAGTEIQRLTLTESAANRLDIQTSPIETSGTQMVAPSAAVIIDPDGVYWVYTNPEPLVYVREEIRPVTEAGGEAFFDIGPPLGMAVVTVGVPELYGAEFGIGK